MKSSKRRFPPQKTPPKNPWKALPQTPAKPQSVTFIKSPIKLTISLLVSNRIDTIRKCLDSIKPLLTQLPSELIVVDTVGEEDSDGSLAVAREYTDKIVRFHWCDDFAAARNAGLKLAQGEWFMFLDDDEWFEDVTPIVEFLQGDEGKYNYCLYDIRNYMDRSGSSYQDDKVGRMARRTSGMIFKSKIHEYLIGIYGPRKILNCYAHHYGYIYASNKEREAHSRRNLVPLLELYEADPKNLKTLAQLCQEYFAIHDYKKTRQFCEQALQFGLAGTTDYIGWIAYYYIRALHRLNENDVLLDAAETLLNHENMPELAKSAICMFMQSTDCPMLTEEKALAYVDVYFSCIDVLDKDSDKLSNQAIASLASFQSKQSRNQMLLYGVHLCKALADWDKAFAYIQKYCESEDPSDDLLTGLFEGIESGLNKEADLGKKWACMRALSKLPVDHPRTVVIKMLLAEHESRTRDLPALLQTYTRLKIQAVPAHDLLLLCHRNEVDLRPLMGRIYIETWETTVNRLLEKLPKSQCESIAAYLARFYGHDSPEIFYLDAVSAFSDLKALIKQSPSDAAFDAAFAQYVEANAAYYRLRSHPDNFTEARCAYLEINARAAFFLWQALNRKREGKLDQYLRSVRQALDCRDYLKDIADYILKRMKAQQAEAEVRPSPSQEMLQLSAAIKASVKQLLQSRQWPQARTFLDELRSITPDDPDIPSLYTQLPRDN
ncbi:MAG: glycosyltransferase [Christensenellaceae bacterium]|nr:glycosyltransferase [Christensenellaceae bacterium]